MLLQLTPLSPSDDERISQFDLGDLIVKYGRTRLVLACASLPSVWINA